MAKKREVVKMAKITVVEETIYTKDAKMLSSLEQMLSEFQVEVQCYMALHGHSRAGCLALLSHNRNYLK